MRRTFVSDLPAFDSSGQASVSNPRVFDFWSRAAGRYLHGADLLVQILGPWVPPSGSMRQTFDPDLPAFDSWGQTSNSKLQAPDFWSQVADSCSRHFHSAGRNPGAQAWALESTFPMADSHFAARNPWVRGSDSRRLGVDFSVLASAVDVPAPGF
jgi:hypothetical protein